MSAEAADTLHGGTPDMKPLDELTAHCIRCGFCLESCPTFSITGEETESPRGRIYLARSADEGVIGWTEVAPHLSRCLGCLACQSACPSGVEYGQIFEIAKARLEAILPTPPKRRLLATLTSPAKVRMQLALGRLVPGSRVPGFVSRSLSGQTAEADKPVAQPSGSLPALEQGPLPPIKGEAYLLEGCVMRVLFPRVHECTRRLLRRVGYVVKEVQQGCCGSLHLHAGYLDEATSLARECASSMPGDLPVIVDSAGCGSTMKGYGDLFESGGDFSERVFDVSEFLLSNGLVEALAEAEGLDLSATYHDACHLAHGQGVRSQPRALLSAIPKMRLIDLEEPDACCGSAGIYNVTQPKLARQILERKWRNIEATGASVVALGNPGCHAWIAQAAREHGGTVRVLHTCELLEAAFIGLGPFRM